MSVQPKTLIRPPVMTMATNMSHMVEFSDAFPIELEQKLYAALLEARERLARRGVLLGDLDDE